MLTRKETTWAHCLSFEVVDLNLIRAVQVIHAVILGHIDSSLETCCCNPSHVSVNIAERYGFGSLHTVELSMTLQSQSQALHESKCLCVG